MKVYNVKYGTKVVVTDENVNTPPSSIPIKKGDEIKYTDLMGFTAMG